MSELFASIKAFIEKGNIILFLLALAAAIFSYQKINQDVLWSVFVFCISYPLFYFCYFLYENYKASERERMENEIIKENKELQRKIEAEHQKQRQKETEARLKTFYASLEPEVQENLIELYNLPQIEGGYANARLINLEEYNSYQNVFMTCGSMMYSFGMDSLVSVQHSSRSFIVTINGDFYKIIGEKAKQNKRQKNG